MVRTPSTSIRPLTATEAPPNVDNTISSTAGMLTVRAATPIPTATTIATRMISQFQVTPSAAISAAPAAKPSEAVAMSTATA